MTLTTAKAPKGEIKPGKLNTTPYINAAAVKKLALKLSVSMRGGKFTRVSKRFLEEVSARVAEHVAHKVHSAPSIGKTL